MAKNSKGHNVDLNEVKERITNIVFIVLRKQMILFKCFFLKILKKTNGKYLKSI